MYVYVCMYIFISGIKPIEQHTVLSSTIIYTPIGQLSLSFLGGRQIKTRFDCEVQRQQWFIAFVDKRVGVGETV